MIDEKRPLYTLTVGEFRELNKVIAFDVSHLIQPPVPIEKAENDILFINEITQLTGYKESTVYTKVCRREIPVMSYGRPLTFSKKEILNWMKSGKPTVAEMKAKELMNNSQNGKR